MNKNNPALLGTAAQIAPTSTCSSKLWNDLLSFWSAGDQIASTRLLSTSGVACGRERPSAAGA
jgi:hypothetical protein